MNEKNQNTKIKSEGEYYATEYLELRKQSNQIQQIYQLIVNGGGGNVGCGRRNLRQGSTNWKITPSQAFTCKW